MRPTIACLLVVACVLCAAWQAECARILAVIPTPSYSHQIPYRKLFIELNKRGHEVVLATANPIPNFSAPNFTQIDLSHSYKYIRTVDFVKLRFDKATWLDFVDDYMYDMVEEFTKPVFDTPAMQELYTPGSNATFDLVFTEFLYMPSTYAFAHRFDAPLIGLSSLGLVAINEFILGGVVLPSHEYTWEMEANTGSNLPFLKRLRNFVSLWRNMYNVHSRIFSRQQDVAESYLGPLPPLTDIMRNYTSLFFIDQSDVLTPARPKLANMITFTSFHVEQNLKPLPKDLKKFLDEAKDGFIYFSLGSNARSASLPENTLRMFIDIFNKLPYRVVWKYEQEMPDKPDNIYISQWFPQQSILAHPNIKLFIYQGGLQSSEEAVSFAVPVIGFPVLADQDYQVERMEALKIGKRFDLPTVTKDELESAIVEIITNKEYKEQMMNVRNLVRDLPHDQVDHLAWWTEYVIRHKGAPHLRSSLTFQPWYQRYDTDIVVFLSVVSCLFTLSLLTRVARLVARLHRNFYVSTNQKQKLT